MKKIRLSKGEVAAENGLLRGEYISAGAAEIHRIARAISTRRKDAVLNIRVNSEDLSHLKQKAKKLGVPYQTFISEILHHYAG
ncbi:MAG: hypothetical protein A2X28_03485 [Elusimicrobia bacterium GWA2_56_46]|nr:MAG: hypothetical protein A2X28_03485 [Elusimicrobia bacterium GWA2_56_46]OGR54233.1 MAG: hypothetical protein A2X39_09130 [Elusimicrobia bacterium GWC2_56_31]HBB67743.1 antitoxin [Elusimicrobiota bacterium]HBW21811.1 antitoxin [Elusimicrobiota bacterium]